ncbi:MAG: TetR family transcriptional regulator [Propionibacteriales bacterium]|nr:TetR family transcriptional regulator [Propionibacteriales bacterium]
MTHPAKAAKVLRKTARKTSRRQQYSQSTRKALLESAEALFSERGYSGTSLDEVVAAARVTKGALYHHYNGKLAVFEAVLERCEAIAVKKITRDVRREKDPWQKALVGVRSFLDVCQEQSYRRIVMQEGPVALGYERWREIEERSSFGLVRDIVRSVLKEANIDESILETFTRVFFGALSAAGMSVSQAEDPETASEEVQTVIALMVAGLRRLADDAQGLVDRSPEEIIGGR